MGKKAKTYQNAACDHLSKDSKKVKIFEIGPLEVYERGGGAQGLHWNGQFW